MPRRQELSCQAGLFHLSEDKNNTQRKSTQYTIMAKKKKVELTVEVNVENIESLESLNALIENIENSIESLNQTTIRIDGIERTYLDLGDLRSMIEGTEESITSLNNNPFSFISDTTEMNEQNEALRDMIENTRQGAEAQTAAANSLNEMRARLAELNDEWNNTDISSDRFSRLSEEVTNLNSQIAEIENEIAARNKLNETYEEGRRQVTLFEQAQAQADIQLRERTAGIEREAEIQMAAANSLNEMKARLAALNAEWNSTDISSDRFAQLSEEIANLNTQIDQSSERTMSLDDRLKSIKESLTEMIANGVDPSSQAFIELRDEAIELQHCLTDAEQAVENFVSRTQTIDQAVGFANSLQNSFSSVNEVLGLFGEKSDLLSQTTEKLKKGIEALSGVQAVYNQMLKNGTIENTLYTRGLALLTRAQQYVAAGTNLTAKAFRGFRVALASTGVGLIIILLGELIANFDKIKEKITDTFPALKGLGKYFDDIKAYAAGLGNAIKQFVLAPIMTVAAVINKLMEGDIIGAVQAGIEEASKGLNVVKNAQEGYNKQMVKNAQETFLKVARIHADLMEKMIENEEKKSGSEWRFSEEGQKAYKALFDFKKTLYAKDSEEFQQLIEQEKAYYADLENHTKGSGNRIGSGSSKADQEKQNLDAYKRELESFQSETYRMQLENDQQKIDAAKEASSKMTAITQEELDNRHAAINAAYKAQQEHNARIAQDEIDAANEQYQNLLAAAEKANQDTTALSVEHQNRLLQLAERTKTDELALDKEKQEQLKQSLDKYAQDRKKALDKEAESVGEFYKEVEEKIKESEKVKRNGIGFIDVDAMRNGISEANQYLSAYLDSTKEAHDEVIKYYDDMIAKYADDSETQKKYILEKQNAEKDYAEKRKEIEGKITENTQKATDIQSEAIKDAIEKINEHIEAVMSVVNSVFETMNMALESEIEAAQEKYDAISEKHAELADKVKESNDRITSLQEEAKSAQGGRLVVIQEQISREMEANKELADQEKQLAKDKEKAEADKEKLEKKQKKRELQQQLLMTIANTAMAIGKAVASSPLTFGLPWSAFAAVTGALQAATIGKQISKLADGGMLNGKTHTQGGMRIEGTNIEVEGGEYVINKQSTRKNMGLVSYINSQRRQLTASDINGYFNSTGNYNESPNFKTMFATGGVLPSEDIMNTYETDPTLQAIEGINLQPVVSVVDIANVQKNLTTVTDWTNTSSI